jgi:hypothetical protein
MKRIVGTDQQTVREADGCCRRSCQTSYWRKIVTMAIAAVFCMCGIARAFTLNVVDGNGNALTNGFRWMLEQDTTHLTVPGVATNDSISLVIHKSHAPVMAIGSSTNSPVSITVPDINERYILSVMADGYASGGQTVAAGQASVAVILNKHPLPTAQISIFVFNDNNSINNVPDATEVGLPDFQITLADYAGGPIMTDVFGNPLGTTYAKDAAGEYLLDVDGAYVVEMMGNGFILTDADGKATIKYLAMGKYGVRAIPPSGTTWGGGHGGTHAGATGTSGWNQTATIEGTLTVDAWVTANESPLFLEGFGPGFYHAFFGFVDPMQTVWGTNPPPVQVGNVTLTGTNIFNHFGRPPVNQMFAAGPAVDEAWVGLNAIGPLNATGTGLYAAPCNPDGSFTITNVPPGTYQLVTWDKPLDALFGLNTIIVTNSPSGFNHLGNVLSYRWFGTLEGSVFYDANENGFRDPDEEGIPSQAVNLRFRDGTVYMGTTTDTEGNYAMTEVFPFFKWLVAEVDFARFKATGMTTVIDEGGFIPPDNGWAMPSDGVRNPQPQYATDPVTGVVLTNALGPIPILNTNTGNNLSRSETGPVLTQAMHLFLNQNNRIDWGKIDYPETENGGVSGIIAYQTTRAEEDPVMGTIDGWEPGIPRVQVALYADTDANQIIDDLDNSGGPTSADVDNHPIGWSDGSGPKGPEDVDHNNNNTFDPGDAINIVWSDSWDDNQPAGSVQVNPPKVLGKAIIGSDNYSTWNQVRPGLFDGGYAVTSYYPGGMANNTTNEVDGLPEGKYIIQAFPPPGYLIQTEESQNVVFGDTYQPSKLLLPPPLVGTPANHIGDLAYLQTIVPGTRTNLFTVSPYLSLFPGQMVDAPFANQVRPLADMKSVTVSTERNTAADFHVYTEVPKATRVVGFVLNDLTAEFNAFSPIYGEKGSPGFLPISIRDWAGHEVAHVYSDEFGTYNALVPSTYTVNVPSPSGVAPNMLTIILNDPTMADPTDTTGRRRIPDPFYNPEFSTTPWTLHYNPGSYLYADTPIVPIAGFVGYPNNKLDVEPADHTPVIWSVTNATTGAVGPFVTAVTDELIITAKGPTIVPDPTKLFGTSGTVTRDFGFGAPLGLVTFEGVPLTILSWSSSSIRVRLPATFQTGAEGRLMVTRGDNNLTTPMGVTLTYGGSGAIHQVVPRAPTLEDPLPDPIQEAIDEASPGDLILVGPGIYAENPIVYKPVRLQGAGEATIINANPSPSSRLSVWHAKVLTLLPSDPFGASENAGFTVFGTNSTSFTEFGSRIDGFTVRGSLSGGGIQVYDSAHNLRLSNNRIDGNQGTYCGGIVLGQWDNGGTIFNNSNVVIQGNQILKNGGVNGAGGIAIYTGATGYRILDNLIAGNFCRGAGGGIGHEGLSHGGLIANNTIRNNECFYALAVGGDGGGIFIGGEAVAAGGGEALSSGSGSVTVQGNLIQGNLSGSGSGGGICLSGVNGADVEASANPADWYTVNIFNNIIVNNVAGYAGGGISLSDAVQVNIIHNTVANNDSTATSQSTFAPGATASTPQGAGIASFLHSGPLADVSGQDYSSPTLYDSIIWHNRSFYYNRATQSLVAAPGTFYRDLRSPTGQPVLNARYCLLTSTTGYHASNIAGNPQFVLSYTNTLVAAAVIDEAGNNINVRFAPIGPQGNYHIANTSPAVNQAESTFLTPFPVLRGDFDKDYRPYTTTPDIGADEYVVATLFATNDIYFVSEDTTLTVLGTGVLTNDYATGSSWWLTVTTELVEAPKYGTAAPLFSNGRISYTPNPNFTGIDTFTYRIRKGSAGSRIAQVTLVVRGVNDVPVGAEDAYTLTGDTTLSVPATGVLANDADVDNDPLTAVYFAGPDHGLLTLNPDGSFDYTPDMGYTGPDAFYYFANDGQSDSALTTVNLIVNPALPDFVIEGISLVPSVITNGGTFAAHVKVANRGEAAGVAGRLSVWTDQPGSDVPVGTPGTAFVSLGALPINATTTLVFNALSAPAIPVPGDQVYEPAFRAFADALGGTVERVETNNQVVQVYQVVRPAVVPMAIRAAMTNGTLVAQDMITVWNLVALEMVKTNQQMSPVVSRTLAMVHGAMFDAVNSISGTYNPYRELVRPGFVCSPEAGAAAAAHTVLSGIYTGQVAYLDQALANALASVADGLAKTNGMALGMGIGQKMLEWRADDMMTMMMTNYTVGANAGDWQPTPPGYMQPMMPHWGMAPTFGLMHSMQFRPPAPPALESPEYTAAFNEVKSLGSATSTTRTLAQTQAVMFWTDMPGTVTTVGRWNQIARDTAAEKTNSLLQNARLFALLNVSMADAGIAVWDSKYFYNRWRPVTAIRAAATDGNPATDADPSWTPLVMTPAFPEYGAAHSAFSSAAASALAGFFGTNEVVFSATDYMNPMMRRYFASFSEAANEAGTERVWAGVHFPYGNEAGLALGYAVGSYMAGTLFKVTGYPQDLDGIDTDGDGNVSNDVSYVHLAAGDGFVKMADGNVLYSFGFSDQTLVSLAHAGMDHGFNANPMVVMSGMMKAEASAPTIVLKEGQRFYLDLSNVGMMMRPDLFDPHTVHFHGFPQAAPIFDGEPMGSISVNMGSKLRYYYEIVEPGTFMYHCHVEATEHMEMGMLGNLYVMPKQNNLPPGTMLGSHLHQAGHKYVYNDGDGTTRYDVEVPLQMGAFDRNFHEQHLLVQPLPMAMLDESYPMLNGRGYPDTANPDPIYNEMADNMSQKISSTVTAKSGQRILLRLSNLSISDFHSLTVMGIPMQLVGKDARLLRSTSGVNLYRKITSVTLGGGEAADVILDTTNIAPGTYFIYDTRLNHLSNDTEDFGGMMTEITITAP